MPKLSRRPGVVIATRLPLQSVRLIISITDHQQGCYILPGRGLAPACSQRGRRPAVRGQRTGGQRTGGQRTGGRASPAALSARFREWFGSRLLGPVRSEPLTKSAWPQGSGEQEQDGRGELAGDDAPWRRRQPCVKVPADSGQSPDLLWSTWPGFGHLAAYGPAGGRPAGLAGRPRRNLGPECRLSADAERNVTMTRKEAAEAVRGAKARLGVTWAQLAEAVGRPVAWTTSALLGQQPMTAAQAGAAASVLELDEDVRRALQLQPVRGSLDTPVPADPTMYRFYEVLQVYGPTIKELIHEEFGDGIMSAINFRLDVSRAPDPAGDRVGVTLDGKFLPYQW